ncbi:MAG: 1-acyl-sn-glycerol-3-phosphate acyltransferase [Actinomycetia bacterium]|nr:1-acyl-sn-glycerol-3-phosphate acyltransferase [Actinomycetes bacterium]
MMQRDLTSLTKRELYGMARDRDISGRSSMSRSELVEALRPPPTEPHEDDNPEVEVVEDDFDVDGIGSVPLPGISPEDRAEARARRTALEDRLSQFVDQSRHCSWTSIEGHPCGLPVLAGTDRCGLHGDGSIADRPIPLTGSLGFSSWPTLWRHLTLATYDPDAFGLDPVVAEMTWSVLNRLYYDYFRVEVEGIENVPSNGGAVLVANHGGAAVPYDGAMLALAVMNEAEPPRRVRVIGTEIFNMLPFVSHLYRKVGAAYAGRDDARELLKRGHLLGVFPEGERGFMKPVWEAYRVGRLGRGGFADLAQDAGVPIVPVAIIGSEEVHPAVMVSKRLAQLVRLIFPEQRVEEIAIALNPIPLPIRWKIRFLPPVEPSGDGEPIDGLEQLERVEDVRRSIQTALDDMLAHRTTAF